MCGIIAVVRRRGDREPPAPDLLRRLLQPLPGLLADAGSSRPLEDALEGAADRLAQADVLLRGVPGVRALVGARSLRTELDATLAQVQVELDRIEGLLDSDADAPLGSAAEQVNRRLVAARDAAWAVRHDRLRTAAAVEDLAGPDAGPAALAACTSIQQALSAIDRLEVRGRDSAGLQVLVRGHGLDLASPSVRLLVEARSSDDLYRSGAVRIDDGCLGFVYKAAAEIGELGDNTQVLRSQIRDDDLLRQALGAPEAEALVLGHTRWASVGIVSEANAHPLDSLESGESHGAPVTAVLNGDVDNYADLKALEGLDIAPEITTDAKVIPALVSRALGGEVDLLEGLRRTANQLEGSVAVAASSATAPDELVLALRGSGQALYVGLAEDAYVVASEPYGVVEDTDTYLRMDGERADDPRNPAARGQLLRLRSAGAGTLAGIERTTYDGTPVPVEPSDLATAEITTRDIDRGRYPHYLLKEISEAPTSFRKTLRGKLVEVDDELGVRLPDGALPDSVRADLRAGRIRQILVIGQGTAAVAGHSLAVAVRAAAPDVSLPVVAVLATELSGFELRTDMSDTLVVAVSQSGTTTDTNRTVDLVRGRGASVVAIVNRRNSDLTDKADGVLYTSDGRDVEMAVASTKAFYAQVAACFLLAVAIVDELGASAGADRQALLRSLRLLPDAMAATLEQRDHIAAVARELAPSRRYWAVVGNGVNRIAAHELRIKLSELCYKSIACDSTEDKKHVDLSSEPLILVCATGLDGSTADDVSKEVAIYRAHKAAPIVVATEGEDRFDGALGVVKVPATHPALAFVLSAMAGHLFGYEAALAIDAQAMVLREARGVIEDVIVAGPIDDGQALLRELAQRLEPVATRFFDALRAGEHDGHLEASTATRLAGVLRYAVGVAPLESYQVEHGRMGTPAVVVEDLLAALSRAIDELTRPVDAIKHQAKTVTVGISRSDEALLQVGLVQEVLAAGTSRDHLSYVGLRTLVALEPLVAEVVGHTRYAIEDRGEGLEPTAVVVDRGGIGRELRSRTEDQPVLRGTKRRVAAERQVLLARGRADGRTVLIVPEVKDNQTVGLTLLHVRLAEELPIATLRSVLRGYRDRYQAIEDAVTETEPTFRDDLLTTVPLLELMTDPVYDLAERWRT